MNNISIINFSKVQDNPTFTQNRNGKWINYGSDNLYPQYLLDIFHNKSNKHKAIIRRKVDMIVGNGIKEGSDELNKFIKNIWSDKDLEEISVRIAYDYEICNGFSLFIRWNIEGTKVVAIDYLPFHKVRIHENNKVSVSKDWKNIRKSSNKPIEYNIFDPLKAKEFPTQVFYFAEEANGVDYYPIPYYSSTLNWIILDYEISNYHLSSIENGFVPGFIINFATGIPTEEEKDENYKLFQEKYTGTTNTNKLVITYSEGQDEKPEMMPLLSNDSDKRFNLLQKSVKEEIFIGHSVTDPQLFGVIVPGTLGGNISLLSSLSIFQSTYIDQRQNIIEKQLNKISHFAGVEEPIIFNKYKIDFDTIEK